MVTLELDEAGEKDEALLRSLVPCEEDRRKHGLPPCRRGDWRWFRSTNVVPIERRRPSANPMAGGLRR